MIKPASSWPKSSPATRSSGHDYDAYGIGLSSAVPLPELRAAPHAAAATGTPPALTILCAGAVESSGWHWETRADADAAVWLRVGRRDSQFRLTFAAGGDFILDPVARTIAVVAPPDEGVLPDATRHLLIDQVLPLALSHAGALVLHASACAIDGHAVAFIGPAGAGKSTLAASLALRGCALLADDALVIEGSPADPDRSWSAVPAYGGARIWPDVIDALVGTRQLARVGAYTDKRRLAAADGLAAGDTSMPLRRVYLLDANEACDVKFARLSARDAAMALIGHAFVLDVNDPLRVTAQFTALSEAAATVGVRRMAYPHDLSALEAVHAALIADVKP